MALGLTCQLCCRYLEKKGSDSELAVKQYLWRYDVYDVVDILKGFLVKKSYLKNI